jgi:hypothetical protein
MKPIISQVKQTRGGPRVELVDFEPRWNNSGTFWSTPDTGFASYVLVPPRNKWCFTTEDGRQCTLLSVNGCGEERWEVRNGFSLGDADRQAIEYFRLH